MNRRKSRYIKIILSLLLFCIGPQTASANRTYTKYWSIANIIAPITENSPFRFYLEPQLRLVDTSSVFNQYFWLFGLGYQFNPDLILLAGPGWIANTTVENKTNTEQRIWQQLNWRILNNSELSIHSRSRLEERNRNDQTQVVFRFRQRLWLRVPIKKWQGYSFSCSEEFFFNINHPAWTSPYFFEQNRAFIGIAKQLSKSVLMDVGYLNQFFHSFSDQSDNVILFNFTVSL